MYLCICNGLNEARVRAAVEEEGAASVAAVYRSCGVFPRCGKCREAIRDVVRTRHTADSSRPLPTGVMLAAE